MNIRAWIHKARDLGASDLHVEAGTPPVVRVRGALHSIAAAVSAADIEQDARVLLGTDAWHHLHARGSADASLALGGTRCRINVYRTIRGLAVAVRLLTPSVHGLRECNLHPDLRRFIAPTTGLVIVSGPTGSGKSTTLAALIEEINATEAKHVISLESPIEYVFTNRRSLIRQREIPTHSPSFEQAIIDALRENPDVLVIGEMRTPEVMRLTLNAAETGHLVLATMHSSSCAEALTRIAMSFPAEIQGNIRAQLADCLVGVVCQRLDYLPEYHLQVPRCEVLWGSLAAKATVRSGQMSQIANVIQSGGEEGMWNFDRYRRWMEQKKDWVRSDARAGSATLASVQRSGAGPATTGQPATPQPGTAQPATAQPATAQPSTAQASAAQPSTSQPGTLHPSTRQPDAHTPVSASDPPMPASPSRGTISVEEAMDIEELTDLARQIEKRLEPPAGD